MIPVLLKFISILHETFDNHADSEAMDASDVEILEVIERKVKPTSETSGATGFSPPPVGIKREVEEMERLGLPTGFRANHRPFSPGRSFE